MRLSKFENEEEEEDKEQIHPSLSDEELELIISGTDR